MDSSIAFFVELNNSKNTLENVDLSLGNPGVGGTQYLFLLTVESLNKTFGTGYACLITNVHFNSLALSGPIGYAEDLNDAIVYCKEHGIGTLVINANLVELVDFHLCDASISIILWAHNTLTAKRQRIAANCASVKWIVCVSKSQYINMKDTPCFKKCVYINNFLPNRFFAKAEISDYSEEKIVYVGSLMPQKGVHNLIKIWRKIEKKCPQANLYIFGGANVWNTNVKLGSNGIADPYYERVINKHMKKLAHPENIHFMGAKGWTDIGPVISTFRAGVVNPSRYMRDETFCLSAIEMSAFGLPIVSRDRKDGLRTTIVHEETGYLEKTDGKIADRIVSIINTPELCNKLGNNGRKHAEQFVADNEVGKWNELIKKTGEKRKLCRIARFSNDAILLRRDYIRKILYLFESGKAIAIIKKQLNRKHT